MDKKGVKNLWLRKCLSIVLTLAMVFVSLQVSNMTVYADDTTTYDTTTQTITFSGSGDLTQATIREGFTSYPDVTKVVIDGYSSIPNSGFSGRTALILTSSKFLHSTK